VQGQAQDVGEDEDTQGGPSSSTALMTLDEYEEDIEDALEMQPISGFRQIESRLALSGTGGVPAMHPYWIDPKGDTKNSTYNKYRPLADPSILPEMPKMNNQPPERRIPIWNRTDARKITGNAAPLERNLNK